MKTRLIDKLFMKAHMFKLKAIISLKLCIHAIGASFWNPDWGADCFWQNILNLIINKTYILKLILVLHFYKTELW